MTMSTAIHGQGFIHSQKVGSIGCDVLDAWFDPCPEAILELTDLASSMRISPEPDGKSLIDAISRSRGLRPGCVSIGAGSSEIIHRVLPGILGDREVVLLDPTYSEYSFIAERSGRPIKRFRLSESSGFEIDLESLIAECGNATAVLLVNPNNPTGQSLSREQVLRLKRSIPADALLWVDEAYVDFAGPGTSVERDACSIPGLVVVKSLSKAYALSGLRVAYTVSASLSVPTPPWIVGTLSSRAAIAALNDPGYYEERWKQSFALVQEFASLVRNLGLWVHTGRINAVLVRCPGKKSASSWAEELAGKGLVVRTPVGMGEVLGEDYIRVGLVERDSWSEILGCLAATISSTNQPRNLQGPPLT